MPVARVAARWGGLAAVAFIAYATLSPIELRPVVTGINVEHVGAFAVVGFLLAFGHPRSVAWVAALTVAAAVLLEVGQTFVPGRHGRVEDVVLKVCGALIGIGIAWAFNRMLPPRAARSGN